VALTLACGVWMGWTEWKRARAPYAIICDLECRAEYAEDQVRQLRSLVEQLRHPVGPPIPMPSELREYSEIPVAHEWDGMTMTSGAVVWYGSR